MFRRLPGLALGLRVLLSQVEAQSVFQAATEFSAAQNPAGAWTYGWRDAQTGVFRAFEVHAASGALMEWGSSATEPGADFKPPYVLLNSSDQPVEFSTTVLALPKRIILHPGPNGEPSTLRWTAPQDGPIWIESAAEGRDQGPGASTIFEVYRGPEPLFSNGVSGKNSESRVAFQTNLTVRAGETLDFAIGTTNDFSFDSTQLDISVAYEASKNNPILIDLLAEDAVPKWTLSPLYRWDEVVEAGTGTTNRGLYAANPVLIDSFATIPVGSLTNNWRLSARFEMLRRFAPGGAGFTRFSGWDGSTLLVLADITWSSERNRTRMEMSWWDGTAWHSIFADPVGFFGPGLDGKDVAWKDLTFDAASRRITMSFQPEGGRAREVVSEPLPESIVQRLNSLGVSCVDSEFLIRKLILLKDFDKSSPEPPTIYQRQLSNRDFYLFWAASPGRRYQIQESRDLMIWEDKRFVFGGSGAELLQVALPTATNGFRAFRLLVK